MPALTAGNSPQATAGDSALASQTVRQAAWHLIPLLAVGYLISYKGYDCETLLNLH